LLEIGDKCKEADMEITALTGTLDDLEETLEFIQSKINQISEEIENFDYDSITPLSFHAL
jgi:peptidoglycan hydrolase CwlO-like protein